MHSAPSLLQYSCTIKGHPDKWRRRKAYSDCCDIERMIDRLVAGNLSARYQSSHGTKLECLPSLQRIALTWIGRLTLR